MVIKKNISKIYYIFLFSHIFLWTLIPSISNTNLPLDTIEALAWGSNLDWGFNKHPPFSAFVAQIFYLIFGPKDWAYYFLSQIFVIISFIYVWKFSNEIFENKIYSLISLLALEGILFYNFTTPEFNVNISQLPFWALTVYFFWKGIHSDSINNWIFFGFFSALGFLSKYLFIYILFSIFLFFIINFKRYKNFLIYYILSIIFSLIILTPHFIWLFHNDFITIFYGLERSNLSDYSFINHLLNPFSLLLKQLVLLSPFFLLIFFLVSKFKFKINIKNEKTFFLTFITLFPFVLIFLTSMLTGAKIKTMWMTPFYLFFGTFFVEIFRKNINLKMIKKFNYLFLFLFILSPVTYFSISKFDDTKRTDYPGKEISMLVQNKWNENFRNDIKIVIGDEWFAGNLSYHLSSRPVWISELKKRAFDIKDNQGVIYTGNPQVLKKICPGFFGTIKPVGYCMIGKR